MSNWLRRYSAHPWASPLRGQSKLCSKTLPAFLCRTPVCPTGCAATQPIPGPRPFGARASSVQKRSRRFCVEPRSGVLIPPVGWLYVKKKPVLSYELFLKYGGEGGIRTPDTLPYTHFPGVLLQPLGHLTILYCCLTTWGATGRYYRELR